MHKRKSPVFSATVFVSFLLLFFASACRSNQMTVSDAINRVSPFVVQVVVVTTGPDTTVPIGSGFLVNRYGYVVTASHVIKLGNLYVQTVNATSAKIEVIIPAYKGLGESSPETSNTSVNDFNVVARDDFRDLTLLKITDDSGFLRTGREGNPSFVYSNGTGGTLVIGPIPLRSYNLMTGDIIGASGYPTEQLSLKSIIGRATSSSGTSSIVLLSGGNKGTVSGQIFDYYSTYAYSAPGNSGGPVYLISDGSIVGVCVTAFSTSNLSASTLVVPARYVIDLLNRNGVIWGRLR